MAYEVTFSFEDKTLASLKKMGTGPAYPPPACRCIHTVHAPAVKYREVAVTNPETGETFIIVIPDVQAN